MVAAVHLAPTDDCPDWAASLGDAKYERCVAVARAAVAAGAPDTLVVGDFRMPPLARFGPTLRLRETARSWLAWWGQDADTVHTRLIAGVEVPVLLLSGTEDDHNTPERMDALQKAGRPRTRRGPALVRRLRPRLRPVRAHGAVTDAAAWRDGLGIRPGQAQG